MIPVNLPTSQRVQTRHRLRLADLAPWAACALAWVLFPNYLQLGSQVMIMVAFALSLDLLLGYAGVVTLGHAAFFGIGAYTAGILSVRFGVTDPLAGLALGALAAGAAGLACGLLVLRTTGLTLLMLTLGILLMLSEAANRAAWLTGGADGLQGVVVGRLLGVFEWDLYGRTAFVYSAAVAAIAFVLLRVVVMSPMGRSLVGIRENPVRLEALGAPVRARLVVAYGLAALIAGMAGAVNAQVNQFVGLNVLSFELSGAVLIMLILGGTGRLYGAFVGAPIYMIAADAFSRLDPTYWLLWIGVMLIALVMFARGGVLGWVDAAARRVRARRQGQP
jgi:branched-chain amino acid transport system permease protein